MERREEILAAAGELFAEQGYGATTVAQIARRARVANKAFYSSFESREACYLALLDDFAGEVGRRVDAACAAEAARWPERAAAAIAALFDLIAARPAVARACMLEPLTVGEAAVWRYERAIDDLALSLSQGRRLNPRGDELPGSLERTLIGGVAWTIAQRLASGGSLAELLPESTRFLLAPYLGEKEARRVADQTSENEQL